MKLVPIASLRREAKMKKKKQKGIIELNFNSLTNSSVHFDTSLSGCVLYDWRLPTICN